MGLLQPQERKNRAPERSQARLWILVHRDRTCWEAAFCNKTNKHQLHPEGGEGAGKLAAEVGSDLLTTRTKALST